MEASSRQARFLVGYQPRGVIFTQLELRWGEKAVRRIDWQARPRAGEGGVCVWSQEAQGPSANQGRAQILCSALPAPARHLSTSLAYSMLGARATHTHTPPVITAQRVACFTCVLYGRPQIQAWENSRVLPGVLENTLIWEKKQEARVSPSVHLEEDVLGTWVEGVPDKSRSQPWRLLH